MTNKRSAPESWAGSAALRERLTRLIPTVEALGGAAESRRDELLDRAEDEGLSRRAAEQAYDISREVGLPPAYGLALVRAGVSVRPLDGPRPAVDTSEPHEPEWVDAAPDPARARRERRLRQTFRRLQSRLEDAPDAASAVDEFARAPDLEAYDY